MQCVCVAPWAVLAWARILQGCAARGLQPPRLASPRGDAEENLLRVLHDEVRRLHPCQFALTWRQLQQFAGREWRSLNSGLGRPFARIILSIFNTLYRTFGSIFNTLYRTLGSSRVHNPFVSKPINNIIIIHIINAHTCRRSQYPKFTFGSNACCSKIQFW